MTETTGTGLPPTVEASDHADVAVLLKAAAALWEDADIDGALRWFARAAETASDIGDDRRALELARAIADLKEQHTAKSPSKPPPSKSPPKPPPRRTIATPRETPGASPAKPNEEASKPGMRVSVKTSVRDPDLLIVRVLRNGQVPPSGWGEAILAPTGRGFDLPSPRE